MNPLPNEMSDQDMDEWLESVASNRPIRGVRYPDELLAPTPIRRLCATCHQLLGAQNPGITCDACTHTP